MYGLINYSDLWKDIEDGPGCTISMTAHVRIGALTIDSF